MPTIFRDKVTVGSVTFNDSTALPLPGIQKWGLDILEGWHETPEIDAEFTPIGSVDGEIPDDFFALRGRPVIIGGYAQAPDRLTAELLWDILVRDAFPRNTELTLTRYEAIPKSLLLWVNGPREATWTGPLEFRWGVMTRAADPFKYALTPEVKTTGVAGQSSGGRSYPRTYPLEYATIATGQANSAVVTNLGTGDSSRIVAVLTGPLLRGGWRLVNETTNEILKFDVGLGVSDILTIDFHAETALLNGYPVSATITGDFWRIEPGVNVIKLYADFDAAAGFTITVYSAWE